MAKRKSPSFEEQWAVEIFKQLAPNWCGSVMLFRKFDGKYNRQAMVELEPIYKMILKAVKASQKYETIDRLPRFKPAPALSPGNGLRNKKSLRGK